MLLLGLDCASPQLIFEQFTSELPHMRQLMQAGTWGILDSSIPCITVPAWACLTTGRDPGVLGIYGFRNRVTYDYAPLTVVDSTAVQQPRLWEILAQHDKQSLIMNVPQTYPVKPIDGYMVSGFLTPNTNQQFAFPAIFKNEVLKQQPNYRFDVRKFRTVPRNELLQQLHQLMEVQYALLEHALKTKTWDFAMHVNIGVDRLHHAFWRYHDSQHRLHEPDSPFNNAIRDYYVRVDEWLGRLIEAAGEDTIVLIASDHGVKRMDGAVAINEWLRLNGWLTLKKEPQGITKFTHEMVDWSQTRAWSTGGYYGRIFMNVQGREPNGIIPESEYRSVRLDLARKLAVLPIDAAVDTTVHFPDGIYQQVSNIAPDLLAYFGNLHWRAVGSVGYGTHITLENDTGPDDANHAQEGMYILYDPQQRGSGRMDNYNLLDVAPTVLDKMSVPIPETLQGSLIR